MLKVANSVISASRITGTLPVANGGTGVTSSTGTGNTVLSASPTFSGTATFATLSGGTSGTGYSFSGSAPATSLTLDATGNVFIGTGSILSASAAGSVHIVGGVNSPNEGPLALRNPASTAGYYWTTGPSSNGGYVIFNHLTTGQYMTYGATSWSAASDERVKTAFTPFTNAAAQVASLRAGTGRYLTDDKNVSRSFLIAQDVQKVLPEAVDVQDDKIKTLGLRYVEVIPLLVAAIKELKAEIDQLKSRV